MLVLLLRLAAFVPHVHAPSFGQAGAVQAEDAVVYASPALLASICLRHPHPDSTLLIARCCCMCWTAPPLDTIACTFMIAFTALCKDTSQPLPDCTLPCEGAAVKFLCVRDCVDLTVCELVD